MPQTPPLERFYPHAYDQRDIANGAMTAHSPATAEFAQSPMIGEVLNTVLRLEGFSPLFFGERFYPQSYDQIVCPRSYDWKVFSHGPTIGKVFPLVR